MKKIVFWASMLLVVVLLATAAITVAVFAADSYTEISTAAGLKGMNATGNYRLTADIALTDGTTLPAFSGKLDGNGKKITGLTAPLFEELSGSVTNLTITGSADLGGRTNFGSLANTLKSGAVVENCLSEVTVRGTRPSAALVLGGLVGTAEGNAVIRGSVNKGNITVTGAHNAENDNAMGGIAGRIKNGVRLERCENYGVIYADGNGNTADFKGAVGGILGISNGTTYVENCLNAGEIKASYSTLCIGGILGRTETDNSANPNLTNCINTGNVTKTNNKGERPAGIASYVRGGNLSWCANLGKVVSDNGEASGLVGYYNGSGALLNIAYSYNAGTIEGKGGSFAIMRVNGMGNLRPVSNFYLTGTTACNENMAGTNACANAAELTKAMLALPDSVFCADLTGNASLQGGYPIARWQCTHACDTIKDAEKGIICSNCGALVAEIDCDHSFGSWTTTKPATATENGERQRTCTKCGAVDREVLPATTSVLPENGVYTVKNAEQLIWLFAALQNSTVPADVTLRLGEDIDVKGKLPMLTVTFTGVFDGNGKTLSGISNTLFNQFNGSVRNLTLRGDIDVSGSGVAHDTARKAASFALNAENGVFTNLVSYVNLKTEENDLNAGGLVGYARATNTFTGCRYLGNYTAKWVGDGAGIGGIVGWSNASGGTTSFVNCSFGGKITVTGGVSGKETYIGGILGNCTQSKVEIRRCTSTGEILSEVTAGSDFAGGIVGINKNGATVIEFSSNKAGVKAVHAAGGILGGISDNTQIRFCSNDAKIEAETAGALCGTANGKTLKASYSVDFAEEAQKLCGTSISMDHCYTSDKLKAEGDSFAFGGVTYQRYNNCLVEKDSGILVETLSTNKLFAPYISIRDDGTTHAVRIVILTNRASSSPSVTVSIVFKDASGKAVKTITGKLATTDSDFTLYSAVLAGGESYFAAAGQALFGYVITDIPSDAWDSVEVSVKDTASGAEYLAPVSYALSSMQFTPEDLPGIESLGSLSPLYNAGPGLLSDQSGTTKEDGYMTVITDTTAAKLADYVKGLEGKGYTLLSKNTLDGDVYYTYKKLGTLFYFYHNSRLGETRILTDNASDPLSEIAYDYTKKAGDTTALYQYSLNYTNANRNGYDPIKYTESGVINCGMCYIIKLPDNKVIVIDSGHETQSTAKSRAGLMAFLREITGTKEGEKVTIAMWFFTHAHGDHVRLASDFLTEYRESVILESVTYNFPSYQVLKGGYDSNTFTLKKTLNTYYKDVAFHKLHTGEVFSLAGVKFEVVYTHEDAVTAGGTSEIGDFNSSSTVLKVTIDGKVLMILGDISGVAENAIVAMHSPAYLKADMVQVTHHCFNYLYNLYPMIDADIALFPQSKYNCANSQNDGDNLHKYELVMKYATEEYFAHKYTYEFTVVNGKVTAKALPRYDQR